ncbi:AraC family transcriptional regulator [[Clostridium] sordellii]|uniref:AraC family transcriptional regulator n=1 Tax=Paraclostridium sordellii TaxID=1505 RepID=UPI0002D48211|nr:AraC family transcriptional regulator [Paeniclostridium sordellii]CEK30363.1 AraC family transcriptional regulator [[Clostridium] sordellii] [Paeniclostridium sordellii]
MFKKTTSPQFDNFGISLKNESYQNHTKNLYTFKNKSINSLKFTNDTNPLIYVTEGVVMILVSKDSKHISNFIINKPIKLDKNTYFNLISISNSSSVFITKSFDDFNSVMLKEDFVYSSMSPSLNISEIYTKFYQEKGSNYKFSGEYHSYWELTYVDKGILETTIDKKPYTLFQGDLIFYAPYQFHTQSTKSSNTTSYITINFNMDFDNCNLLCNKVFSLDRNAYNSMKLLIKELSDTNLYSNDLSICYLKQLIINILRIENEILNKPTTNMKQIYENNLLNKILNFIDLNITNKIFVDTICLEFNISPTTLHSLFKKNVGTTVKNYINKVKLNKSKDLINKSEYTFSEIADYLAFSSIHYFSKKFKSEFGISPTEYAKSIYKK